MDVFILKVKLRSEFDEMIGTDFSGQVVAGNRCDDKPMGKFGIQDRDAQGQILVDFHDVICCMS